MTRTLIGTCPVCTRDIAVHSPAQVLVHHGYRRPGVGSIVGDCFAAGFKPYELSTEACKAWRHYEQQTKAHYETRLADLAANKVTQIVVAGRSWRDDVEVMRAGVTHPDRWYSQLELERISADYSVKLCQAEIDRMDAMIAAWKLEELGTETRNSREQQAARAAKKAEREAKRAERQKRREALANKRAVKAAQFEVLKVELIQDLEALAEHAEATDALQASATLVEALTILERHSKAFRKAGFHLSLWDLDRGELFYRLGLARRRQSSAGHTYYGSYAINTIGKR